MRRSRSSPSKNMVMVKNVAVMLISAALLAGAACFFPSAVLAGSCCGGGQAAALVLPKFAKSMVDASVELEKYDGFWSEDGRYLSDQPGTDLRQYRFNAGYALRLARRWQASVSAPYVWNDNRYSGVSSRSAGPGDATVNLWYETFDSVMCRWSTFELADLSPAVTFGLSLTVPTGVSPYDDVESSFDITGRGFYRLDGNVLLDQTVFPWSASLFLSYGTHFERPVNREYGEYVPPYHKKLGDRAAGALALSYIHLFDFRDVRRILTYTATLSVIREGESEINGGRDAASGLRKSSVAGTIAYSALDREWTVKLTWSHALKEDGWGDNFPASDIYSLGVSYAFR